MYIHMYIYGWKKETNNNGKENGKQKKTDKSVDIQNLSFFSSLMQYHKT